MDAIESPPLSSAIYKVHDVEFSNRQTRIVCHDRGQVCPPLVAVCNYLLLKGDYLSDLKIQDGVDCISQSDLAQMVASITNKVREDYMDEHPHEYEKQKHHVDQFPLVMPAALQFVTDIDPFNTRGTQDFNASTHLSTLAFLGIPLYHGWIVEPKETRLREAIGSMSSHRLREYRRHSGIIKFITDCPTELTAYGLTCLNDALFDGKLAGLYRNDSINVILKHEGSIYVLVTDKDVLNALPTAMWKSLNMVHRDEVYFTSKFIPLPAHEQPNKNGKQWVTDREREAAAAAKEKHEREKRDKKNQRKKEKKQQQHAHTVIDCQQTEALGQSSADQVPTTEATAVTQVSVNEAAGSAKCPGGQQETEVGGLYTTSENPHASRTEATISIQAPVSDADGFLKFPQGQETETDRLSSAAHTPLVPSDEATAPMTETIALTWVEHEFLKLLEGYIYNESKLPIGEEKVLFYGAQVEFMNRVGSFDFGVRYTDVEKFNRELASAIRSDKDGLTELLTPIVVNFLINNGLEEKRATTETILIFHDVPDPESVQDFLEFVNSHTLVWPYKLLNKKWANSASYIGRKMALGYLEDIFDNHKARRSWGGKFKASDLKVINGKFIIDKHASEDISQENIYQDLKTFIQIMEKHFRSKLVQSPPAYFNQFLDDIMKLMPNHEQEPEKFEVFRRFLRNHLAFKAPLVRSTLIRELFTVCQSLREYLDGVFVYWPLDSGSMVDWKDRVMKDRPYSTVYYYENTIGADKFERETYWNMLQYSRFFIQHLMDHTKVNGLQSVHNLLIIDLMLGDRLEDAVSDLIWHMMQNQYGAEFSVVWRHYENSDYNDDPVAGLDLEIVPAEDSGSVQAEDSGSVQAEDSVSVPAETSGSVPADK